MQPLISICIPTYGRELILKKTIESILLNNTNTDFYEICISDNSPTDETKQMLQKYFFENKNIIYKKSTSEGYYNSIEALKIGKGKFLKLHNNYTCFKKNYFDTFINEIKQYDENTVLFFLSNGKTNNDSIIKYNSFNDFLNYISYLSTWSSSFGIWKKDLDKLLNSDIEIDSMFPHTSLLFFLSNKSDYIINKTQYFENQDVKKKGGYNLPETFGTRYLKMCDQLLKNKYITQSTYDHIKTDILHFISDYYINVRYFKDKYTFDYNNWESIIFSIYGQYGINYIKKQYRKSSFKCLIKKILNRY